MDLGKFLPLLDHRIGFQADDLRTDRPIDNIADFDEHFAEHPALFRDERRIRRDAVQESETGRFLDFFDASGIKEEFHGYILSCAVVMLCVPLRSEEHTSELQSPTNLVC